MMMIESITVGREELVQVLTQFPSDHKLVEFLPDRGCIQLVGLYHAIDGSKDVFVEEGFIRIATAS